MSAPTHFPSAVGVAALHAARRHIVPILTCVFAIFWFGGLELRGLFVPDEGRYAEIPREMAASGDWVTPRLNDLKYFEKPPLQYWLTALSFRILGEDEWTARLPSALLGFALLVAVAFTARRLWGARAGIVGAAFLGSTWGYFLAGQYLTLDMVVTAFLGMALCAFVRAQAASEQRATHRWMIAAWVAAALAVLSKGLIGVVLPALALGTYVAVRRDVTPLRRLAPVTGIAVLLAITAPWFVLVQLRNPEFFEFFFVNEHLRRFAASGHQRPGAWWYYAPILLIGLLPWTPLLLREALAGWRRGADRSPGFSVEWFCVAWAVAILLFFSVSHSKLPAYVLPALPALALLVASRLRAAMPTGLDWAAWTSIAVGGATLGLLPLLPGWAKFSQLGPGAEGAMPWLYLGAGLLAACGIGALWAARRRHPGVAVTALLLGTLLFWNPVFAFLHALDENFSTERLIETFTGDRKPFEPKVPFYSVEQFDHSVPFYLGRTVTLVATRGELGPGIDAEPAKVIATIEEFERRWLQHEHAYAIMRPDTLDALRQRALPHAVLARDRRLVIIGRTVPPP